MTAFRRRKPTVVLLDLHLMDGGSFALARTLAALAQPPCILALTKRADVAAIYYTYTLGFSGVLWKNTGLTETLGLALVEQGGRIFPPEFEVTWRGLRQHPDAFFKKLSQWEIDLLQHFGRGESDAAVALCRGIAPDTAKWHRRQILAKLGLHSTRELMQWASEHGFAETLWPAPPCMVVE